MLEKERNHWLSILEGLSHPTPYMITDLNKLRANVTMLKELLPKVVIYYAVKSRSDPKVIQALDDLVAGYDIASLGEFKLLRDLGIKADRMLYSDPIKMPTHISATYKQGVKYYAFDSLDEVKKLSELAPDAETYLRVKVSDYGSKFPLSSKFGVDQLHAVAYADTARDMGLNVTGIAFHVGSQSENPHTWKAAFETAGQIIKRLSGAGIDIKTLNIGGGLPAVYTEPIATIKEIASTINKAIDDNIPADVKVIAEPGRFISANSSVIVTSVIGREHRGGLDWLYLDMGVFQGLLEPLEMEDFHYPIFNHHGEEALAFSKPFVLTGPTCDAYDTIGFDYLLPSNIKMGDQIYIGMTGAYSTVYKSNFNGFEPPDVYYLEGKASKIKGKELISWPLLSKKKRQKSLAHRKTA